MKRLFRDQSYLWICVVVLLCSCKGGNTSLSSSVDGDTIVLKYAQQLQMIEHEGYTEVLVRNPWKEDMMLHRYLLVPKGEGRDGLATQLQQVLKSGVHTDIVRTPLEKSVIFTSPHCQLLYDLGKPEAVAGVCDLAYINIRDIHQRANKNLLDCGSSMQPSIEKIIDLQPDALLISPFENSGGFGKLEKLSIPIVESADYMETSPLGRAEWIRFYGLLFGCKDVADSLFMAIEKEYQDMKEMAAQLPKGHSILTERKTGSVWYTPGGRSTIGILLKDANAQYAFAQDTHSGSLALSAEQMLDKAAEVEVWAFKYFGGKQLTKQALLQEYQGYSMLHAFKTGKIYECDTSTIPYFEEVSFHPERLLREFILLAHPQVELGGLKYYRQLGK